MTELPEPAKRGDAAGELILVATGADRPGLLDEVSHYVADRAAEVRQTRVANLRGRFALLLLVAGDAASLRELADDLPILRERAGVRAWVEPADGAGGGATRMTLRAGGDAAHESADGSASLRQLSNLLRVLNVNIADVQTGPTEDAEGAEGTEAGGFEIRMGIDVPADVPPPKFRELLGQLFAARKLRWQLTDGEGDLHE